jgi:membrane protein EpsK
MAQEGSAARLVRNTLASGATSVMAMALSLVLLPFLIDHLGAAAYGTWALALSLSFVGGYATLTDLGVEGAAVRYVAEGRAAGDAEAVNRTVSTALAFFTAAAIVISPLLVLAAGALVGLFDIHGELRDDARLCFMLIGCYLLFELPARAFFAAIEGAQRLGLYQGIEAVRALLQAVVTVAVILAGWGIVGLGGTLAATSLFVLVAGGVIAKRTVPGLRISPRWVSRIELRRLITFGGTLFLLRISALLYRQMDRVIIGLALGVRAITPYEVANRIQGGALMVQSVSTAGVLPAAAYSHADPERLRDMYLRGTRYSTAASLPFVLAGIIFAGPLIHAWIGDKLDDAVGPTRLFLACLLFVMINNVGTTMLIGLGRRLGRYIALVVVNVLVNLAVSIALVHPLGISGVMIGTLAGNAILAPALVRIFLQEFGVSLGQWTRGLLVPMVPIVIAQGVTAAPLLLLADSSPTLPVVAVTGIASVASGLLAFARFGMGRDERAVLTATIRAALGLRVRQT